MVVVFVIVDESEGKSPGFALFSQTHSHFPPSSPEMMSRIQTRRAKLVPSGFGVRFGRFSAMENQNWRAHIRSRRRYSAEDKRRIIVLYEESRNFAGVKEFTSSGSGPLPPAGDQAREAGLPQVT